MSDVRAPEPAPRGQHDRSVRPLMAEFAVVSTLLLIAAPVVIVGGTLLLAAQKKLSGRTPSRGATGPERHTAAR